MAGANAAASCIMGHGDANVAATGDTGMNSRSAILRGRGHEDGRVGAIELFFDLVFVFAVTQLSHYLLHHPTPGGAFQAGLLFAAVWWVWVYTIWCTNWLNTDATSVRLMLFAMMAAGLFLAMAISDGFGAGRQVFGLAFAAGHVGRPLFMLTVLRGRSEGNFRNFRRILCWACLSSAFWIAGALVERGATPFLWVVALTIDLAGPANGFRVPGLGRSTTADWDVEAHHLSERCGLFVIIALGESLLLTGATFQDQAWNWPATVAFASAFASAVGMWWIYFHIGAERATDNFAHSDDRGRVARFAYTYVHMLIVAGIIVSAAGDEVLIAHPAGHLEKAALAFLIGGPFLFLAGVLIFKRATVGTAGLSHMVGLSLLLLLGASAGALHLSPVAISMATSLILALVAMWETVSFGRASARGEADLAA